MSMIFALAPVLIVIGFAILLLPRLNRDFSVHRTLLTVTCAALTLRYIYWRITETLPQPAASLDVVWAYTFLFFELGSVIGCLLSLFFMSRNINRSAEADLNKNWFADSPPRIDIFIPTYNENASVLEPTIMGALNQSYSNSRVFVLDDKRRDWLKELCSKHGVGYLTRPDNTHAKAGNINAALRQLRENGTLGDFVAIFDADFVAFPNFLERTLSLFHDKNVGVVQTPQHFFNADPMQHSFRSSNCLPDEQRFFFDVLLPAKDAWGVAFSCGTSSLSRSRALECIGGIPVDSITEDMLLSQKLRANGWQTVYLNERLSMGLAPEGLSEYITQRSRWCVGFIQIFLGKYGLLGRQPRAIDRILLLDTFFFWAISFPFRILCIFAPILFWFFGWAVFETDLKSVLYYLGPMLVAQLTFITWIANGRFMPIFSDAAQLVFAGEAVRATATALFRSKDHKFTVTAKGGDRSRVVVQWKLLIQFGALIGLTLGGMIYHTIGGQGQIEEGMELVMFWSYFNIIVLWTACFACIELPRPTGANFFVSEDCHVVHANQIMVGKLLCLGVARAEVVSEGKWQIGDEVHLFMNDLPVISATVKESDNGKSVLHMAHTGESLRLTVKKLFSGLFTDLPSESSVGQMILPMFRRFTS